MSLMHNKRYHIRKIIRYRTRLVVFGLLFLLITSIIYPIQISSAFDRTYYVDDNYTAIGNNDGHGS